MPRWEIKYETKSKGLNGGRIKTRNVEADTAAEAIKQILDCKEIHHCIKVKKDATTQPNTGFASTNSST